MTEAENEKEKGTCAALLLAVAGRVSKTVAASSVV